MSRAILIARWTALFLAALIWIAAAVYLHFYEEPAPKVDRGGIPAVVYMW